MSIAANPLVRRVPTRSLLKLAPLLLVVAANNPSPAADFIVGADLSHLSFFESRGVVYRSQGQVQDPLLLLRSRGLTCVRLRLFTSNAAQAQADPYNYINNLDYTLPLALRVKSAGLQLMLDFHFSDTWADPGHQRKPNTWTNLTFPQLVQQVHDYTSNTLVAFQTASALPDYVQIGNEISGGLLWPDGRVGGSYDTPTQWAQLGQLLNAAAQGIKDASGNASPKIIIHIDRGGDWAATQWFFDNLGLQHVSFDIIGESYYPFWHGSLASLARCLTNAAQRYAKPILVAETGFPWTNSVWGTNIVGLPASPDGQVTFLAALRAVQNSIPATLNGGVLWWGAEYQHVSNLNEAGFDAASFFGSDGNVLPIADAFGSLALPPALSIRRADPDITLRWPLSAAGAFPMTTTNLGLVGSWIPISLTMHTNQFGFGATSTVDSETSRFYRLR